MTSPSPILLKDKRLTRLNRYAILAVFLLVTALSMGDLLEVIPYFAPFVTSPLFPFLHETHDLLALVVVLYAAHKLAPAVGGGAMAWFLAVHIPYAYLVLPKELPELVRLAVLAGATLFGVYIIAVRNRLEAQLNELAADLEAQRTAERRRADELTVLNRIVTVGMEATGIDELIKRAIEIISDTLYPADYFAIGLVDEAGGVLRITRSTRSLREEPLTIPLGQGVIGRVAATGKPWRVPDVRREPVYLAVNPDTRSELCVPLKVDQRTIGLINVESKRPDTFSEADERLLTICAGQLATAIEKARLFGEVQRLAVTDDLTGLYNRRHFFELAEIEFGRAGRYGHPLAAVFLDLDHFKQMNDTYGHAVGDQVLRVVAARCRDNLRKIDIMGRYGGEEFAALLPENDMDGARNVAERLRRCVADPPVDTDRGRLVVTVSVGVATLDNKCADLEMLLERADQALYAAKQAGRNQVCVW